MGEENEEFDKQTAKRVEEKLDEIKKDPYHYICDYVESLLPHVGKKVFEVLSLMPVSLIIPDLPYMNKKIRSNINCLFLAPSGSGKSTLARLFSEFTLNPLEVESITSAKLEMCIAQSPKFSLVVGDFARMSRDPIIIKVMEGILGEEKTINRQTMRTELRLETDGVGLICGTPTDLSHYLSGGLLFRLVPVIILANPDNHSQIGKHIKNNIGRECDNDIVELAIKAFYKELAMIQNDEHPNIKPIDGYYIEQRFGEKAFEVWDKLTKPMVQETHSNFFRSFQEFFRFLVAHAFLNVHKRKLIEGKLYPNEEDFQVALDLMSRSIELQYDILKTERFIKSIRNLSELQRVIKDPRVKQKYKDIIANLAKVKSGRLAN